MNDIDNVFKTTLAKIKEEKVRAIEESKKQSEVDQRMKKIVALALQNLSKIATEAFQSDGDFSSFMIEKSCKDPYGPWMSRMIVANIPMYDIVRDLQDKKVFRIYAVVEMNNSRLTKVADFKSLNVSCGYWWFCRGQLHVDAEVLGDGRLLHYIHDIDSVEKFVEICTRSNTPESTPFAI